MFCFSCPRCAVRVFNTLSARERGCPVCGGALVASSSMALLPWERRDARPGRVLPRSADPAQLPTKSGVCQIRLAR
jgi:hypothetical protein